MSVQTELDRRVQRLERKLKAILALYLLHQLTAFHAKQLGSEALDEAYRDFMAWFRRTYKTPDEYNHEATRIMKVLFEITEDFDNVIDKKGQEEQVTERALKTRTFLIALGFLYALQHAATIELAVTLKAPWIRWNTMEDPNVCSTCEQLKGLYRPQEVPERPHPSCRCFITIIMV